MKLMIRAAIRNNPSQVRHCAVTPKIIINFWQKWNAFWACCTAKIRQ